MIRCGSPSNVSGPTFFLLKGKTLSDIYTDEYLVRFGAAKFSSIIMTENAFLTDDAWKQIVPKLIKGLRHQIVIAAAKLGIDKETADKLKMALTFDGFKTHLKNLHELLAFAKNNVICAVEGRDSSEINQASISFHAYTYIFMHACNH